MHVSQVCSIYREPNKEDWICLLEVLQEIQFKIKEIRFLIVLSL